jgi:hypothetical protein
MTRERLTPKRKPSAIKLLLVNRRGCSRLQQMQKRWLRTLCRSKFKAACRWIADDAANICPEDPR